MMQYAFKILELIIGIAIMLFIVGFVSHASSTALTSLFTYLGTFF